MANVHMSVIETINEYFDTEDYDPENTPDRYDAERLELEMENKERIPPEASNIERSICENASSVGCLISYDYEVID